MDGQPSMNCENSCFVEVWTTGDYVCFIDDVPTGMSASDKNVLCNRSRVVTI